jgi:DNA-directed RNA polymerase specialized sigma24 family protein
MTEPDLAQRLADDLDGSFEALVLVLQGPVYRFAYRWCGNAQDAEEIAQDTFVRA